MGFEDEVGIEVKILYTCSDVSIIARVGKQICTAGDRYFIYPYHLRKRR